MTPRTLTTLGLAAAVTVLGDCAPAPSASAPVTPVAASTIDVRHYDFAITLPDDGPVIRGVGTLSVAKGRGSATLPLDLLLPIDSVAVDGRIVTATPRDGGATVPLDGAGDSTRVTVWYHGAPQDGLIISRDPRGGWQAFGDNWPNRGRHWLPLVDRPGDKATVTWTIDAPAALTVVANGTRTDSAARGARTVWRWSEAHPIPTYVMVIAAARMIAATIPSERCLPGDGGACIEQRVYRAADVERVPAAFGEAPAIVGFYSSVVAPFPYERLDHLESSTRFGGMENATAIFYADGTFRRGTMGWPLIAHETAHQWFGDAVTERDWPHLWLSEGFATYFAELFGEHRFGADTLVARMRTIRKEILADSRAVARRPVIDTIETDPLALLNANSYQKGGFVLHMARRLLGDSAFFGGVRRYWRAHRDGNATSDDLRRALEVSSGRELGWFFDQWLRRPGYPELATEWSYDRQGRRVYLEIAQGPRFGSFRFPLVVEVTKADGTTARATVEVPAQPRSRVAVPLELDAPPSRVALDPDADLLAAIDTPRQRQ
ncbi:MAG: M1 family metallopeptidase [Gemmatimonadaceae bacterium]|nr:M1 family metallopeptidase [Gemmatimonadaceae bacterium]NUQ92176.1 M1 family metallopeptidase [Gemmatimonadaceae bacterium]NUR20957.1 M1 family metallopeptidase [Gemmatimonadaceae bacterium]